MPHAASHLTESVHLILLFLCQEETLLLTSSRLWQKEPEMVSLPLTRDTPETEQNVECVTAVLGHTGLCHEPLPALA